MMGIARDLAALDGITGAGRLIRKIGQRDRSALSEARAIHLLRSAARVVGSTGQGGEPNRHIAVRIAYTDDRAEAFLRNEARQLPRMLPG